ncbi:MAG: hypothetical protein EU529_01975 [Promethearchaeota archaeon]|nr:MAG: hypothetical protein EU529_01975 [Candidatus Lokiarchaeota archaeon]
MIDANKAAPQVEFKEVRIVCPQCNKRNELTIPSKIINQSKQLTTVSIPSGLVCEHTFQAFIDKNFKVRGYQKIDYELSKMEFFEGSGEALEENHKKGGELSTLTTLPMFQEIIDLLRSMVDDKEILGSGLFTLEGNVIYSSLPHMTLSNTIREFESREKNKLSNIRRMLLELDDEQKVCSQYMHILGVKFILVLLFNSDIRLGMGIVLMSNLAKKIEELT